MRIARIVDETGRTIWAAMQKDGSLVRLEGNLLEGSLTPSAEKVTAARWLSPLDPRAIICIGLNYRRHAKEGGAPIPEFPVVFMKNPMAATGHLEPIRIPRVCEDEVDYEAELVVVIGRACRDVSEADALDYVLGYTVGNDVSARVWQSTKGGSQWVRGKAFDTFAPMGPVLVTADEIPDPNTLAIRAELNGQQVQSSNTNDMIFSVRTLIRFLSEDTTLLPGTVIMTGTPEGVGWFSKPRKTLRPGDQITIEIENLGRLTNPVH